MLVFLEHQPLVVCRPFVSEWDDDDACVASTRCSGPEHRTAVHARSAALLRLLCGFHSMVNQCMASRFIQEAANSKDGIGILQRRSHKVSTSRASIHNNADV
jgi:hypothetical protein